LFIYTENAKLWSKRCILFLQTTLLSRCDTLNSSSSIIGWARPGNNLRRKRWWLMIRLNSVSWLIFLCPFRSNIWYIIHLIGGLLPRWYKLLLDRHMIIGLIFTIDGHDIINKRNNRLLMLFWSSIEGNAFWFNCIIDVLMKMNDLNSWGLNLIWTLIDVLL